MRFTDRRAHAEEAFLWRGPGTYDPLVVYEPKTWLLRAGWKKAARFRTETFRRRRDNRCEVKSHDFVVPT